MRAPNGRLVCDVCDEAPRNSSLNVVVGRFMKVDATGTPVEGRTIELCDVCLEDTPPDFEVQCQGCGEWFHLSSQQECDAHYQCT